jgi:hypothetical protein
MVNIMTAMELNYFFELCFVLEDLADATANITTTSNEIDCFYEQAFANPRLTPHMIHQLFNKFPHYVDYVQQNMHFNVRSIEPQRRNKLMMLRNPLIPLDNFLADDDDITLDEDDIVHLLQRPDLHIKHIDILLDRDLMSLSDCKQLHQHPILTWEFVLFTLDEYDWNLEWIIQNPNITEDIIRSNLSIFRPYLCFAYTNPNITPDCSLGEFSLFEYSRNPNVDVDYVLKRFIRTNIDLAAMPANRNFTMHHYHHLLALDVLSDEEKLVMARSFACNENQDDAALFAAVEDQITWINLSANSNFTLDDMKQIEGKWHWLGLSRNAVFHRAWSQRLR